MSDKVLVNARVRCINKATMEFFDRDFRVDLSTLPASDAARIERLINQRTVRVSDFRPIRSLFLFDQGLYPDNIDDFSSLTGFYVDDYFEDEEGNPLDQIGLVSILTGEEFPILPDNVGSVLRLGPTGIQRKEAWNVQSSNTLAHFYQLVEVIGNSDWMKIPVCINTSGDSRNINSFECPNLSQLYAILLPFRQLYSNDDALNHACKVYLRHTADERKRDWVKANKNAFNGFLDSAPKPHNIEQYSVRQLLDLVMYGAGLIHYSQSERQTKQDFKDILAKHPRERVIFTLIWYCHQLYGYANRLYFVLRQDHHHWLTVEGCAPPDLVFMHQLFESRRLDSRTPDTRKVQVSNDESSEPKGSMSIETTAYLANSGQDH